MEKKKRNWRSMLTWLLLIILVGSAIFSILFFFTMLRSVNVGHALILVDPWAKTVSDPIVGPAWVVKMPWVSTVDILIAIDTLGMWGNGTDPYADFPTVKCFSRDQLEMTIDIMLRWRLDVSKVKQLYQNLPRKNWKGDVVASIAREQVRLVTKEFTTIETIEQRENVVQAVKNAIWSKLETSVPLAGALVDFEFELRNIGYPIKYTEAIEDKLVTEQQKIQAEFEREKIIILANASAQQMIIESKAEAQAKIIVANGTREAIESILAAAGGDASNTTRIAELYLWIETLKQIAPEIDLFLMTTGEDGIPILVSIPTSTNSTG